MNDGQAQGFNCDELQLPYTEWKALSEQRRPYLAPEVRRWLRAWDSWDLAVGVMNDEERRRIRYGHFLGWFDRDDRRER